MTAMTIVNLAEAPSVSLDFLLLETGKNGDKVKVAETRGPHSTERERLFLLLGPKQRELVEEMLRLFIRGVSLNGKARKS